MGPLDWSLIALGEFALLLLAVHYLVKVNVARRKAQEEADHQRGIAHTNIKAAKSRKDDLKRLLENNSNYKKRIHTLSIRLKRLGEPETVPEPDEPSDGWDGNPLPTPEKSEGVVA